jgi:hypothetical protein
MRHFLIIFIAFLLLTAPLYGQSINCSKENIKKMIDFGWSDYDIKQVCEKSKKPKEEPVTTTPSKPEKEKTTKTTQKPKKKISAKKLPKPEKVITVQEAPKTQINIPSKPLNYSNKLGVRSNEGSLITKSLNPPKLSNTRFYLLYGKIVNSEENHKISYLHTLDTFKATRMIVGIDNRLADNSLHYISLSFSSTNSDIHQRARYDSTSNNVYYNQLTINRKYIDETLTLEYVHHLLNDLLIGLSFRSSSINKTINYDYQWFNSTDDSTYGSAATVKYTSNHDYSYNSLRLQKIYENLRFDFHFTPEVTSKDNYSGDYTGESTSGFGRSVGLNTTIQGQSQDISFGFSKENENTFTADQENESYLIGYNYWSPNIVYNGTIGYTNYKKISTLVEPSTMIDVETILSFSNTYFVGYNYINYNYGDLGESSDKYRITDQYINTLYFGISFDL